VAAEVGDVLVLEPVAEPEVEELWLVLEGAGPSL